MRYQPKSQLMSHQKEGLRLLMRRGGGGLLFEPGCGKTFPTLVWLHMLALKHGQCRALVLAPLSALDTWPDEMEKHLDPELCPLSFEILNGPIAKRVYRLRELASEDKRPGLHLLLTNHDALSRSSKMPNTKTVTVRSAMVDSLRKCELDAAVVDEMHAAKGHSSNLSRALASLAPFVPRRVGLTGTVMPHDQSDLWAQWRWINPDRFEAEGIPLNYHEFRQRFCRLGGFRGKQVTGPRNEEELGRLVAQDALRVRKEDALDLPPVTDSIIKVNLTDKEKKVYLSMGKDLLADLPDGTTGLAQNQAVRWLRLRQITSGHTTNELGELVEIGSSKITACVDLVANLVEANQKVVVFAHFRPEVDRTYRAMLKKFSRRSTMPVRTIHGGVDQEDRRLIRKEFFEAQGPAVVVCQMRTVSLAINEFVASCHGVFMSVSERRDDYIQARDRLDRNGQTRPVTLHHLVVRNSMDEAILKTHRGKGRLEETILQHARSLATLGEAR